jgi:hypothetical protein
MKLVKSSAGAHALSGDESIADQLGHQLLGMHHLPFTAILIFGNIVLCGFLYKNAQRDNHQPQ